MHGDQGLFGFPSEQVNADALLGTINDNAASPSVVYTVGGTNDTYSASGMTISLPGPGTYLIWFNSRCVIRVEDGVGYIVSKLRNTTDNVDIASSERLLCYANTIAVQWQVRAALAYSVTVTKPTVLEFYVFRGGATTWTNSVITSDTYGRSAYGYVRLSRT